MTVDPGPLCAAAAANTGAENHVRTNAPGHSGRSPNAPHSGPARVAPRTVAPHVRQMAAGPPCAARTSTLGARFVAEPPEPTNLAPP